MNISEAKALVRGWPFDRPVRVHAQLWWEADSADGDGELSSERACAQLDVEIERLMANIEFARGSARVQLRKELDMLLRQRKQTQVLEWGDEG